MLSDKTRKTPQILYAGNNLSPNYMNELIEAIGDKDFSVNVISKSGTTTEPAIAFRIFREILENKYGIEEARSRIYVTTDKQKGALKTLADGEGYEEFVIPDNIGGRYSVLTAVGLLPIAVAGIDIDKLMEGARIAQERYADSNLKYNECYQYAVVRNILYKLYKNTEILVNYEPKMHYFTEWWKQLYGESEGKEQKGIFPAGVDFTTDLHSMGQYIQEGRRNLFETVISINKSNSDITINPDDDNLDGLNYLAGKKLDFVNSRKIMLPIILIVIVGGLTYSLIKGFNFAVDFTGGTSITVNTTDKVSLEGYTIDKINSTKDSTTITIKEKLNKDEVKELSEKLEEEYNTSADIYVVSDLVKKQLIKNAIIAVLVAFLGITVYVSIRFRFNYAISGIAALLHDVLITTIFFGVFKLEIDSIFIAALLTIIGYSINDTIVTFDMIRRNYKNRKNIDKEKLKEIVNDSVRLTFFRSIMTTVTTIIPIICLIIFGASEILNFNLALLVGFIAGVFSSIYVSNQLWLILESRRITKPKKEKKKLDEVEELKVKGVNC